MSIPDFVKIDPFKLTKIIAIILFVISPPIYLVIMYYVKIPVRQGGEFEIMQYILLMVGMLQPLTIPLITKVQVQFWKKSVFEKKNPASLFLSLALIKYSMIVAIYIYGLVVYFLSGDMTRALYFYPIGMTWSAVHWPTRGRFETFVRRLS